MSSTSRSTSPFQSSPATPESSQNADFMAEPAVRDGQVPASWDLAGAQSLSDIVDWVSKDVFAHSGADHMLTLDDLIAEDALEPEPAPAPAAAPLDLSSPFSFPPVLHHQQPLVPPPDAALLASTSALQPDVSKMSGTAVRPPREACHNLLILVPNVPATGAKSRVETQIRMELTLTTHPANLQTAPDSWDKVASWPWLRLPKGSATKRRPRKEAPVVPPAQDVLDLSVDVICTSNQGQRVTLCESCKEREVKRKMRKAASRVRPAKHDDEAEDNSDPQLVHFNCPETIDFSTGMAALPLRITCYCRHHKEKTGFSVLFSLRDAEGRLVGTGSTPPVMITDDHKSNKPRTRDAQSASADEDAAADKTASVRGVGASQRGDTKKRSKPYERERKSRVASSSSPAAQHVVPALATPFFPTAPPSPANTSPPLSFASPSESAFLNGTLSPSALQRPFNIVPTFSPPQSTANPVSAAQLPYSQYPTLFSLSGPLSQPPLTPALPKIHRLIPATGPTHGGIEITVLGSNFDSPQLSCFFGGTRASSTQKWSDNTLVCILPPRATAGPVAVIVERSEDGAVSEEHDMTAGNIFTYMDESDRALMELALQVVGLKMTGKIEEAKNVALRIVGSTSTDSAMESDAAGTTTLATDPRQLLLQYGKIADQQTAVVRLLSAYFSESDTAGPSPRRNALSHKAPTGQTMLHLATILNMSTLVSWLLRHGIDVNAQDRNGFTALHFAVLAGSRDCAAMLFRAGADRAMRTYTGLTPKQLAGDWVSDLVTETREPSSDEADDEDYASEPESDAESFSEDSPTVVPQSPSPSSITRRRRPRVTSGSESSDGEHDSGELDNASQHTPRPPPPTPNEKQRLGWLHRKLANLQPPPGIIPNVQVPWDWGALPQIPVFYVPVPSWMWSGDEKQKNRSATAAESESETASSPSAWEKLLMSPRLSFVRPMLLDDRQDQHTYPPAASADANRPTERPHMYARIARSVGYSAASVGEAEINSYGAVAVKARRSAKQDRMLMWFWLPILLLGLAWVLYAGVPVAYQTVSRAVRTVLPLRDMIPAA